MFNSNTGCIFTGWRHVYVSNTADNERPDCLSLQSKDPFFQQSCLHQYGDFTQIYTPTFALNIWASPKSSMF
jgi:hypothetical protein